MKRRALLPALLALALFLVGATQAHAILDNKGKDFILAFLPNAVAVTSAPIVVEVHLTSDVATNVTVNYPVNSPTFTTTVAVNPGSVTIVTLPVTASTGWTGDAVRNNCVRAFSDDEFVCYMVNRRTFSSDAALALPIEVLNTDYIAATYSAAVTNTDSDINVFAAFDNTTVTITPSKAMIGGHAAGVPFNVTLNRGEGYFGQGTTTGAAGDLTGTIITADKPIGLTNGNNCTFVPSSTGACDHIFEMAQPVQSWGDRVLAVNLPSRTEGSIYRVIASQPNTQVTLDGAAYATLTNAGSFVETAIIPNAHVFAADKPIFVVQYMTGVGRPGTGGVGDPSQGNLAPTEQYVNAYTFSTVGGAQFSLNWVTIIAHNDDVGTSMELDGTLLGAGTFTAIPGTDYSYTIVSITSGTHTTSSDNGHGITVEGMNAADSYLYPGGALFQFINPVGDPFPPVCGELVYGEIDGGGPYAEGGATDDTPSEDLDNDSFLDPGEDLNNNGIIDEDAGIFFVELAPGSIDLVLNVTPFVPGAGSVTYTVSLAPGAESGSGMVIVTDGAGNTCSSDEISLVLNQPPTADAGDDQTVECSGGTTSITLDGSASSDPDNDALTYEWRDDNNNVIGTTASINVNQSLGSETYTLTVDDGNGETDSDQVTVTVEDTEAPTPDVATLPDVTGECSATITTTPTATDGCGGTITGTTDDPLSYTTQGTHTVTWTYDDGNGNTSTQTQTVVVDDVTAPTLSLSLSPTSLWPPNHSMRSITATITTSDNCTTPTVTLVSITSNEAENGLGDGDTPDDIQGDATGTDDRGFSLRAERSGSGSGRIYTVTYMADDGNGNTTTRTATVTVPRSNGNSKPVFDVTVGGATLGQNTPNPFNGRTEIGFTLPTSQTARLDIYSVEGNLVRTLVDGILPAGEHVVNWDGRDASGKDVSSGVYLYQLKSDGASIARQMILVR